MDAEVFRQVARDLPGHWLKGSYSGHSNAAKAEDEPPDRFCALGHLARALGEESGDFEVFADTPVAAQYTNLLDEIAIEQFPEYGVAFIWELNDNPLITEDDIVAIFEKAAARTEIV